MKQSTSSLMLLVRVPILVGKRLLFGVQHAIMAIIAGISVFVVYTACRRLAHTGTEFTVEGLEHVPASGPVLIVSRHFHHLYDGCILLTVVPRRLHLLVALDWTQNRRTRFLMELVCSLAEWPVVLRSERLSDDKATTSADTAKSSSYSSHESRRYIRHAITECVHSLRNGQVQVIFPEAYPNIDPVYTLKTGQESFLPFRTGVARIVEMAERDKHTRVAVVPAGLHYMPLGKRWQVTLRFGPALSRGDYPSSQVFVEVLEQQVRDLSRE